MGSTNANGGDGPTRKALRPQAPPDLAGILPATGARRAPKPDGAKPRTPSPPRVADASGDLAAYGEPARPEADAGTVARPSGDPPQDGARTPAGQPEESTDGDVLRGRTWERREAERMLRLYVGLWGARNAGRGRKRTWPANAALAKAITDARADLGLSKVPLPAPVVSGSGPECRARVLAGLWIGEGDPPQAPTLTETPALATAKHAIADEYAAADMASTPGDTSWRAPFERRRAEAESEAARLQWAESAKETWAAWCFGRMQKIPDALLRAAGAEADSKTRQQVFLGGSDAPVEAFQRFLVAFGGERPNATRRLREARPLVDVFAHEYLPAVIRTCLGQGRAFVLPPDRTPEMALARGAHGDAVRLLEEMKRRVHNAKRTFEPEQVETMLADAWKELNKRWLSAVQAAGLNNTEHPPHVYLRLTRDTDFREAAADLARAGERKFLPPAKRGRRQETLADVKPLLDAWSFWAETHIGDKAQPLEPSDTGSTKDQIAVVTSAVTGAK